MEWKSAAFWYSIYWSKTPATIFIINDRVYLSEEFPDKNGDISNLVALGQRSLFHRSDKNGTLSALAAWNKQIFLQLGTNVVVHQLEAKFDYNYKLTSVLQADDVHAAWIRIYLI